MDGSALSREIVALIADRADWLVDAVACSTQNRMFLRGEKECDADACGAILLNGKQALTQVAQAHAAELERLRVIAHAARAILSHMPDYPDTAWLTLEEALTPSRHPAGSPIPLDGATRTEPGFDGRPAPLAASAPDTVAGAAQ